MDKPPVSATRAPWLSIVLAAVSASAWAGFYAGLFRDPIAGVVFLLAGPFGIAGIVVGIIHAVRRAQPRWLPFAGITLSIGATVYIVTQFLQILASLAFA